MNSNGLTRRQESLIRSLYTRHGRRKAKCCVCEGLRAARELYTLRPDLVRFTVATEAGSNALAIPGECCIVGEEKMRELSGTVNSQGILAVAAIPEEPSPDERPADPFLFAVDRLGDPGNFGTICRTLRAAGLSELWYTKGSIDPYGDKAVRSALGAQFSLKLRSFEDLAGLSGAAKRFGYAETWLTDPHDGENCFTAPALYDRSVIVIGGEANGVSPLPGAKHVMIPMPGNYESLNAAQAATIFLFEYVRRSCCGKG
ncbi:RNA methyltransferase [uncultured Victivallis sp.]|uniref:TrmH family RNA methyltransferase n=1 Tax=uncultured Victivallis sp. TaxID=354118 RepID=UPI0025F7487B|nr:RNA methyltransferase [uncultured Victivallis sp.]